MSIIETVLTKCRDCYRCVRACPVKAIRVERGVGPVEFYTSVVDERCVHCGICLRECPQGAKKARSDVELARELLRSGEAVAASVAPSFAAVFPGDPFQMVGALRKLGFKVVQETALGAEMVAAEHRRLDSLGKGPFVGSSCPVVVSLVEKHYPGARKFLAPVVSPAIAHGRYLKKTHPGIRVIFVGPCVAKKDEIAQGEIADAVDIALTYRELQSLLDEEGVKVDKCEPGSFDGPFPKRARAFPIDGGLTYSSCDDPSILSADAVWLSGISACVELISSLASSSPPPTLADLLACPGGCIAGPFVPEGISFQEKRKRLINYQETAPISENMDYSSLLSPNELKRSFTDKRVPMKQPTRAQLKAILEKSGKFSPEDELNCGACGYESCREKAIAVHNGMADPEMCIPFMRQRAESMANLVVGATPNGILVTSLDGTIMDMNQSAEKLLGKRKKECVGTRVAKHMDPKYYLEAARTMDLASGPSQIGEFSVDQQVLYVSDQKLLVGFMFDVTREQKEMERRRAVAEEAVTRAQSIIDKQMSVAQKIAGLLGETTAETKLSLKALMKVVREERPSGDGSKG